MTMLSKCVCALVFSAVVVITLFVRLSPAKCKDELLQCGADTIQVERSVSKFGANERTTYKVPLGNGKVEITEAVDDKEISVWDGKIGYNTYEIAKGRRNFALVIVGAKHRYQYADIDGDGMLDVMLNRSLERHFILVEQKWIEVKPDPGKPREGSTRISAELPETTFVFQGSSWAKE